MALIAFYSAQLLSLCLVLNPFCPQRSFKDSQYTQIDETMDWVVKARNVRYDVYEILRLVKPDTLWDVEQALKRKGVQNADKISYLIEKERVDFARDRIQLLELGWYDKDGNELHRDVVEDPRWELHKRHVQLLRNVFKPKGKSRVRNRSDYSPPNSAMLR